MAVNVVLKSVWNDAGIKQAQSAFDRFGKSIGKIGTTIAAALSVRALVNSARAAVEDAKSQALLAEQLRNTTGANELMIASVEESIRQMQISAAVADDVLRPAFAQLVRATGDVGQATRLMQIALDVSAATGRDVNSVTIALSKAYQGNTTALSRLGIMAQDGVDVFAMLEEQFAGAAETAARNDPFQRLTIIFGELQEQIGQNFLPLLNDVADYFAGAEFSSAFKDLAINVGLAVQQIDILFRQITGNTALTSFINLVSGISYEISKLAILFQALSKSAGLWFSGNWIDAARFDPAAYVRDQIKKLDTELARLRRVASSPAIGGPISTITTGGSTRRTSSKTSKKETAAQKAAREQREGIEKARKIIAETAAELAKLQAENTAELAKINTAYTEEVARVTADFNARLADIVQQSQDRLREAYRSAVAVNISELFGARTTQKITTEIKKLTGNIQTTITRETEQTIGGSVTDLVAGLKDKLEKSRQLLANSASLASAGFSQTFIEQVVGAGTETGNELANAILQATPQTQQELRDLFTAVETESETGMDALAKSIYDKAGLATRELKQLYSNTVAEQATALKDLKDQLDKDLLETNTKFKDAVSALKDQMMKDLAAIKTDISSLTDEIQALIDKMYKLTGVKIDPVIVGAAPDLSDYLIRDPRNTRGNTINITVKTDPTKSAAETGRQVAKVINKYTGKGGGLKIGTAAV